MSYARQMLDTYPGAFGVDATVLAPALTDVSVLREGDDGEAAPVGVEGGGDSELAEDVVDVLFDRAGGYPEGLCDSGVDCPSAMSRTTSRSRGVSASRGSARRPRPRSSTTSFGQGSYQEVGQHQERCQIVARYQR